MMKQKKKMPRNWKKVFGILIGLVLVLTPILVLAERNQSTPLGESGEEALLVLGESGSEESVDQSPNLSLGASGGPLKVEAPDRKIPLEEENFDLALGLIIEGKNAEKAVVEVTNDGGFDGAVPGDYQVEYKVTAGEETLTDIHRTITVTEYKVDSEKLLIYYIISPDDVREALADTESKEGEDLRSRLGITLDMTEEEAFAHIQPDLRKQIKVYSPEEELLQEEVKVQNNHGFDITKQGVRMIDFVVELEDQVQVEFQRKAVVRPGRYSTFWSLSDPYSIYNAEQNMQVGYGQMNGRYGIFDFKNGPPSYGNSTQQYWSMDANGTVLWVEVNGTKKAYVTGYIEANTSGAGAGFTTEVLGNGSPSRSADKTKISLKWSLSDLDFTQTIGMVPGTRTVDFHWNIKNKTGSPMSVRMTHGGDTYFNGKDYGYGYYNSREGFVYVKPEDYETAGMMSFQGDKQRSPQDSYFVGQYNEADTNYNQYRTLNEDLPNIAEPVIGESSKDMGFYLQWVFNIPAHGEHDIYANQQFTKVGRVQVFAPAEIPAPSGIILPMAFTLVNTEPTTQTATLDSSSSPLNWDVTLSANSTSLVAEESKTVIAYVRIPDGVPEGTVQKVTLGATDVNGKRLEGTGSIRIQNDLPAIQDIEIVDRSNSDLTAKVTFKNVSGTRKTTVHILDSNGDPTGKVQEKTIPSGGTFTFNISDLTFGQEYIIRAYVDGIDYYSERTFLIEKLAEGLSVTPAEALIKKGETAKFTPIVTPSDAADKGVKWTSKNTSVATVPATSTSGVAHAVTGVADGIAKIELQPSGNSSIKKEVTVKVDGTAPTLTVAVAKTKSMIPTNKPVKVTITATDPTVAGVSSGVQDIYYRTAPTASAPSFNPNNTTDWTKYTVGGNNTADDTGKYAVWAVAIDKVGNVSNVVKSGDDVQKDTVAPVLALPDIALFVGDTAPTFPHSTATATDNVDGTISLTSAHVDKTTVDVTQPGYHEVTYTVQDNAGNTATGKQKVFVHGKISITTTPLVKVHIRDTAEDFPTIESKQILPKASVIIAKADGSKQTVDLTSTISKPAASSVPWGQANQSADATYSVSYTYPNGIGNKTASSVTKVVVGEKDEIIPGSPTITITANKLYSYETEKEITASAIQSNANSSATVTYTIENHNGVVVTSVPSVAKTVDHYTVHYKAVGPDGKNSYKAVPLETYGKMSFQGMEDIHTLESTTNLPNDKLNQVRVAYKAFDPVSKTVVTKTDGQVTIPTGVTINAVQVKNLSYTGHYPSTLDQSIALTGTRKLYVQGIPVIKANSITIGEDDTASDLNLKTDVRIALSATVQRVTPTNSTPEMVTIPVSNITSSGTITFGTQGDYPIHFETSYTHPNITGAAKGTKDIVVTISDADPNGPDITVNLNGEDALWQYIGDGQPRYTVASIKSKVNATEKGTATTVGFDLLYQDVSLTDAKLTTLLNTPGSYILKVKATDGQGRNSYLNINLNVVGAITIKAPNPLTRYYVAGTGSVPVGDVTGNNGYTGTFTNHLGVQDQAKIDVTGQTISLDVAKSVDVSYKVSYPTTYPQATFTKTETRKVNVHENPVITLKTGTLTLNPQDTASDFNPMTDPRVDAKATVKYVKANNTVENHVFPSTDPNWKVVANTIQWGVEGTYKVTYSASFTTPDGKVLQSTKDLTVTISKAGDPNAPQIKPISPTAGVVKHFQGNSPTLTDARVKEYVKFTDKNGATITPTTIEMKADGFATLAKATETVGTHTIQVKITDNENRTGYGSIPLYVYGPLTFEKNEALDAFQETGGTLPDARYRTGNLPTITFLNEKGEKKPAKVKEIKDIGTGSTTEVSLDTLGYRQIAYTIEYPAEVLDANNTGYVKIENRVLRVHGRPVFQYSGTNLQLRIPKTGATAAEIQTLKDQMVAGITATVSQYPTTTGAPVSKPATVKIVGTPNINSIGEFDLDVLAEYTLPAGYNSGISVEDTDNSRHITLHGNIETQSNDITISTKFKAADFASVAFPQMGVKAEVTYHGSGLQNIPVTPTAYTGTINFGTPGDYTITYAVDDNIAAKPAGLATQSTTIKAVVHVSDQVIGAPPVITGVKDYQWIEGTVLTRAEAMVGVTASDADQPGLTGNDVVATLEKPDGSKVVLDGTGVALTRGTNTVTYFVQDEKGNETKQVSKIYVHSELTIESSSPSEVRIRQSSTAGYVPDIHDVKVKYYDGEKKQDVIFTIKEFPQKFIFDAPSYVISTPGEQNFSVTIGHPKFAGDFSTPSGGTTVALAKTSNMTLRVFGPMEIKGMERYDSTNDTNAGGLPATTYFVEGNATTLNDLLSGITATQKKPTITGSTDEDISARLTISAPKFDMSKPNCFAVTYTVADTDVPNGTPVSVKIIVQVDGIPQIKVGMDPIFAEPNDDLTKVLGYAKVSSSIVYGNQLGSPVVYTPQSMKLVDASGTQISAVGPQGSQQFLEVTAHQPDFPSNTITKRYPVTSYRKPVFNPGLPVGDDIVIFKNEATFADLKNKIDPKVEFIDPITLESKTVPAEVDFGTTNTSHGDVYQAHVYYEDPYFKEKIVSQNPVDIFVLNRAYIQHGPGYIAITQGSKKLSYDELAEIVGAVGFGERPDHLTKTIRVETFPVTYDFSRLNFGKQSSYPFTMEGLYGYGTQTAKATSEIYLKDNDSSSGSSKPDAPMGGGIPGGGGAGGPGGQGNGGNNNGLTGQGGTGGYNDFTGESFLPTEENNFWKATSELIAQVGSKETPETWSIQSSTYKNPTKKAGTTRKVIGVPETMLELPHYVLDMLVAQNNTRLELDLGNYRWYFNSANGVNQDKVQPIYSIGVTGTNNKDITKLLGEGTGQQLSFGVNGGFSTKAFLGTYVSEPELQGKTLYMYYYNKGTKELELVGQMQDLGNNWYSVGVQGEKGEYVITDKFFQDARMAQTQYVEINPGTGGQEFIPQYARELVDNGTLRPDADSIMTHPATAGTGAQVKWIVLPIVLVVVVLAVALFLKSKQKKYVLNLKTGEVEIE